jgi:hypothetical protein
MISTTHAALACTLTCLLGLPSCPTDDDEPLDMPAAPATTTTAAMSDETTTSGSTSTDTTDATGTSTGELDIDPADVVPCTAIDIIFVVDNSSTMSEEQVRLSAAAPNFIASVRAKLPDVDTIHVGVISTDTPSLAVSASKCGPFASGLGFMTPDDTLPVSLVCAAQVGVAGSPDERPLDMLLAAVDDLANEPGGLNSDFVRKDALLVAVLVTDEEDDHELDPAWGSDGDPPDWFAGLTAIKDGRAGDVVALSLVGTHAPNACPPFQWDGKDGAEPAARLAEFTGMFPFGRVGDVCAPSYDQFFLDAVPVIADACANFIPVE